ncbi:MAG: neutral/alkaline non-lysosomal ceramidase N-terminal domain-containing protein [Clostridia bacterium]|nr:neutral/alkaline non-lysosomal ceramidase N-terminal domain-containing protein [Clostridia bacterium]
MTDKIFKAGAARADITPPVGTLLYGYNPHQESTSIHDHLSVTALAMQQGEDTAILLTVTVGDFQTELVNEIRGKMSEACGVPAARIVVAATHTHSAPNVAGMEGWGGVDRDYVDSILFPAMLQVVQDAVANLQPAEYAVGVTESKVGINRRQQYLDGSIGLGQNPWGVYDPFMTCVAIRNSETKAGILNLIHYGCHGTAAGCNREISRDWSGIMIDRLEKETGVLTAYWNGSQGDVGPRLTNGRTTGDIFHVEELGGVAAMDAKRAYDARGIYVPGSLRIFEGEVAIPYKPLLPREQVEAKLASYSEPEKLINIQALEYAHYKAIKDVYDAGVPEHDTHYRIPQTIIALGEVSFIPFPFEIFSEISLRLRYHAPTRYTLSLSNTNGYNAYLPTEDQIVRGGYEILCFLYSGAYTLVNNADQVLLDENLRIMNGK